MKRRGSVLMEFIIVAPLMLILISMILQFAQIWIAREITAYAAYCACRSVLSAGSGADDGSNRNAELGAQRAAELACSWMCLAGMPGSVRKSSGGASETLSDIPRYHDRTDISTEETIFSGNGAPVSGEIVIPGWGAIPGSDSAGSNDNVYDDRWEQGDRRVKTMIIRAPGYRPESTSHDDFIWIDDDKVIDYALVRVKFKFPLLLPLAGRMISWFAGPNAFSSGGAGDLGRAGTIDYGSHSLSEGSQSAWRGEETVMDEYGQLVDRSSVSFGTDGKFPAIELTEYCRLPMPYSCKAGIGNPYAENLPKYGGDL